MQTTNNVLLIRPSGFVFNTETAASNAFQSVPRETSEVIAARVLAEFDAMAETLAAKGINVRVVQDTQYPEKPDAIFPNNWVSFHRDGTVVLYPMHAQSRRTERRTDIVGSLKKDFAIRSIVDLSQYENEGRYLEGTGSIVFDHLNRIAYACRSPRTDKELFHELCERLGFRGVYFGAFDADGTAIYHTNVMMCITEKVAVICLASVTDETERRIIPEAILQSGLRLVEISLDQMSRFAGNMLGLTADSGESVLVMSQSAFASLDEEQRDELGSSATLLPISIPTIESVGGGSVRCMIAEIFMERRK